MSAPVLMNATQIEDFAAWLSRIAGRRKDALADKLRAYAQALLNPWSQE